MAFIKDVLVINNINLSDAHQGRDDVRIHFFSHGIIIVFTTDNIFFLILICICNSIKSKSAFILAINQLPEMTSM